MNLDHAVVIGASISGLLTARVLSDYFRQVTLLDRDSLPIGAGQEMACVKMRKTLDADYPILEHPI